MKRKPRVHSLLVAVAPLVVAAAGELAGCCQSDTGAADTCSLTPVKPDGAAAETEPDSMPGSVNCGATPCDPPDLCCLAMDQIMCIDASMVCMGIQAKCDGPEDCEGVRCCAIPAQGVVDCRIPSQCPGAGIAPGDGTAILCHSNADCPDAYKSCTPITYMGKQFKVCAAY